MNQELKRTQKVDAQVAGGTLAVPVPEDASVGLRATMTREESALMGQRETLQPELLQIVDETMDGLREHIKEARLKFIGDDRCAKVEAALIGFVIACHRETER